MGVRLVTAALVCAAPAAHAAPDDAPPIDVDPGVPIDPGQVYVALRGRMPDASAGVRVRIEAIPDGVVIAVAGRRREVQLAGRTGADAARLVALAMLDLLDEPAAPEQPPVPDHSAVDEVDAAPAPRPPRIEVGVLGGASQWGGALATAGIDVVVPAGGHLFAIDAAVGRLVTGDLPLDTGLVRASIVGRAGVLEARGSLVVAPVLVDEGTGDTTLLVGFGANVGVRMPVTDGVRFVIAAGADVFPMRTEYSRLGMMVAATPWLAPWATLGFEVAR